MHWHLQILWPFDENTPEVFIASVDGIHVKIQEPRQVPSTRWYSHKSNSAGLAYEVAVDLHQSRIVSVNGPFQAGVSDIAIFKQSLIHKIPPGKKVIADKGYRGVPNIVSTPNQFDPSPLKAWKSRARARHETLNSRLTNFQALSDVYRHAPEDHQSLFEAVCVIVQYDMENGHELFAI